MGIELGRVAHETARGTIRDLIVKDAGAGLDPQSADRLLDAFYTTNSGGTGVGLSIRRSIIESDSGKPRAEANDGPSTTFSSFIPRLADRITGDRQ